MRPLCFYAAAAVALFTVAKADAATFRTEYSPRGFVVLSTFEKPEMCQLNVFFTFMHEGKREEGQTLCNPRPVPEGKDVEFCRFGHERLVDPAASKPPLISCTPAK
jgi:hypothetical protein